MAVNCHVREGMNSQSPPRPISTLPPCLQCLCGSVPLWFPLFITTPSINSHRRTPQKVFRRSFDRLLLDC